MHKLIQIIHPSGKIDRYKIENPVSLTIITAKNHWDDNCDRQLTVEFSNRPGLTLDLYPQTILEIRDLPFFAHGAFAQSQLKQIAP